jgi:hypothetical protein
MIENSKKNRRTTIYLTKENQRILCYFCEKYGENMSQIFMRALNVMYQKDIIISQAERLK